MRRILFLDNSIKDDRYKPLSYWEPVLMSDFDLYRAAVGEFPANLDAYSHIFLTGSTASVLDNTDWIRDEQELIRTAVDQGKVMVGSCFESPDNSSQDSGRLIPFMRAYHNVRPL